MSNYIDRSFGETWDLEFSTGLKDTLEVIVHNQQFPAVLEYHHQGLHLTPAKSMQAYLQMEGLWRTAPFTSAK